MGKSHHFRKVIDKEFQNVESHSRFLIKSYLNYLDDEITEKDERIKLIENVKLSKLEYLFEIIVQFITFAFGGFFFNAYLNNSIDFQIIFVSIFYLIVIGIKIKSIGVNQ